MYFQQNREKISKFSRPTNKFLVLPEGGFGAAKICLRPAGTLLDLDLDELADLICIRKGMLSHITVF